MWLTQRFCLNCREMRAFIYNKKIKHSRCAVCGKWKATEFPIPEEDIDEIKSKQRSDKYEL